MPADIIIYAIIAAGLAIWLRNLLGTNPGDEQRPTSAKGQMQQVQNAHHLELPLELGEQKKTPEELIAQYAHDRTGALLIDNKTAENGLLDILAADKNFDIKFFFEASQDVFAMVVEAFADNDRGILRDMLSEPVYNAFERVMTAREQAGERAVAEIHSIQKTKIIEAGVQGKKASITVCFEAGETSAIYNKDGELIAGHPDKTTNMTDIWTFSRDLKSKDPRWLVTETRGDFEDDNETIPNAGE